MCVCVYVTMCACNSLQLFRLLHSIVHNLVQFPIYVPMIDNIETNPRMS